MVSALKVQIESVVRAIAPTDEMGREHRETAMSWLAATDDVFRRVKPRTPSPHLVSYFLMVDRGAGAVLLCDHRLAGLWLPTGGHVEPGEHPVETVRREVGEELGVAAQFDRRTGQSPFFLTVTETVGDLGMQHTDVSLWYALAGRIGQPLVPDEREFRAVRWWTASELENVDLKRFEPHLPRALVALGLIS